MKRGYRAVLAAALLSSGAALAVKVDDTLYIKAKGVKVLAEAKATAKPVKGATELAVGTAVIWKGADTADKQFHKIKVGNTEGFVLMSTLSPTKPAAEIEVSGKAMDTKTFASSAAATKGLTKAALSYSEASGPGMKVAAVQVINAEEHSKNAWEAANPAKAGAK
jgi:hypothetical protein